jgi:LmbE family N-acetylglucosaminyl deacetylase
MNLGNHNLILTAHPDDETLWAGGLPIRHPNAIFTVICCSIPRRDPVRAWKFFDACIVLGVMARVLPYPETDYGQELFGLETLGDLRQYDCIITHDAEGDYGHSHHVSVNRYARRIAGSRPLITFSYDQEAGEQIVLNASETQRKFHALSCYNHVLPHNGADMTKTDALIERYFTSAGRHFNVEAYCQ